MGFVSGFIWERIHKDSRDFGRGFVGIHETLGEDLWGFARIHGRLCENIHEEWICWDLWGFMRLWERICWDL